MAIHYDKENKIFTLHTTKSTYQMKVDNHGVLLHTYFGTRADETDFSYLIVRESHDFLGQLGDEVMDRTYSLDYFPQEYPVHGTSDFRVPAMKAGKASMVPALDLRYQGYKIYGGKYGLSGLPALFAGEWDEDVQTLEIMLKDAYDEIYVKLFYGVFEIANVITRAVIVENRGQVSVELKRVMSAAIDFTEGNMELIHFHGKHMGERQFERISLPHGITEIASMRGSSSHQHNPFVILCEKDASEDKGGCYGVSLLYSGSFRLQVERDQFDSIRLVCGLSDEEFLWMLEPGENFVAPEVVLAYTPDGFSDLSGCLHRAYHRHLIRSSWKDKKRPALVNNWEATYFNFNIDKLLEIAEQAAHLGLDMMVLDDGWFGKRDTDCSGLGDWKVNEEKLGCTLKEFVDKINSMGLKFGIWVEPEMVSEDSNLYRQHPEWALQIPGRTSNRSRNQLALDLSNRDVIDYLKGCLDEILTSANIEYVKWDMNRSLDNIYSIANPKLGQGAIRHLCVLGLYELQEYMLSKYPYILLEGCNGGGGRFDAGMLYYAPQIWCSDNTDAIERLRIHYGTSFGYPMSAVSAHVSVCPNHQNGRIVPFRTRGVCAMQGAFGYELDLSILSQEEKREAKQQIVEYNQNWKLFQQGKYYRLSSPFENCGFIAWSYVSDDKKRAFLGVVYTDLYANPAPFRVKWKGLQESGLYHVDGVVYTGAALMHGGMILPKPKENYDSYMICIYQ